MSKPEFPTDAVSWFDGMLLAPQHFQQMDRRVEEWVRYFTTVSSPYPWGVRALERELVSGADGKPVLRVSGLEAILPQGGIPVNLVPGTHPPLEIPVEGPVGRTVTVHVGVRRGAASHAGRDRPVLESVASTVPNELEGGRTISMSRDRPQLGGFVKAREDAGRSGDAGLFMAHVPIAEVALEGTSSRLTDFEPPLLALQASPTLPHACYRMLVDLRTRAGSIRDAVLSSEAAGGERDVLLRGTLEGLARGLPRLEALLEAPTVHPFDVFLAFSDVLGSVTPWGDRPLPDEVVRYRHDHPVLSFNNLREALKRALDTLEGPFSVVDFERDGAGGWYADLGGGPIPEWFIIGAWASAKGVADWLRTATIVSAGRKDAVVAARTLGATRRLVTVSDHPGLAVPPDMALFRVSRDLIGGDSGKAIDDVVRQGELLHVFHPDGGPLPAPDTLRLFVQKEVVGVSA